MGNKIEISDEDFDFGFSSANADEIVNEATNSKVEKMYNMIIPLLENLKKDSEKNDYIKWPNRKEIIENFIKKLQQVKDS